MLVPVGSHTSGLLPGSGWGHFWGGALIASSFPALFWCPGPLCSHGGVGVAAVLGMAMSATPVISCAPLGLDQLKALQKNYGRLQQDVLQFQKNQTNLERKFSYDL